MIRPHITLDALVASFSGRTITDPEEMVPFLTDWRKMYSGSAIAVVQPDSTDDVAAVVRWCAANDVAVVPQGGNTGLSGAATPSSDGRSVVLSLARLNRVRSIDTENNTITVEAGCILEHIQLAAAAADRLFPLSLGAEGSCQIGGNLATNAGGTAVLRYGNARQMCLGLEVVTAQGEIWNGLRALRKDNTGYDLRDLFIGSEGTLGVITAAVLTLFPRPTARSVVMVVVDSLASAVRWAGELRGRFDTALTGCEVFSDACVQLVREMQPEVRIPFSAPDTSAAGAGAGAGASGGSGSRWFVLSEVNTMDDAELLRAATEGLLLEASASGLVHDAVIAESAAQEAEFWRVREAIPESQGLLGASIKHDVALPISSLASFVDVAASVVADRFPTLRLIAFGHLGDGNLHFNYSPALSGEFADAAKFLSLQSEVNHAVHDAVRAFRGSISAEHGLGVLRRDEADRFRSPVERELMFRIKRALDPQGIMNPGKVLPSA